MQERIIKSHYTDWKYNSKWRFASYWHQIDEVVRLDPASVLEIGVGSGFVSNLLRKMTVSLTTVDILATTTPDYFASVTELPFAGATFDVVSCYQVLEHLPYSQSLRALMEMRRVARRVVVVSVPDRTHFFRVNIHAPRIRVNRAWSTRRLFPSPKSEIAQEHYWEIGDLEVSLERFTRDVENTGLKLMNSYRLKKTRTIVFLFLLGAK